MRCTWIKVKEACAAPASLSRPGEPDPTARQGQDSWRLIEGAGAAGEGRSTPSNRLRGSTPDLLSGFTPLAFSQPRPTCKATGGLCHAVSMTSPKPWHGGLSGYSILPKDLPRTSGGKEVSYFSILDLLQAGPSHCPYSLSNLSLKDQS